MAIKYPPFVKSIYAKIYIILLIGSFLANRFVYGVTDYGNTLWYKINCIIGLSTLVLTGAIAFFQGYKQFALRCVYWTIGLVALWFLFQWALSGFKM